MGHALARSRRPPATDSRISRPQLAGHDQRLHASDSQSRTAWRRGHQSRHRQSLMVEVADICRCRTEALGGQVYYCANCQDHRYSYHSCKNRHCPKCQNDQANEWLVKQQNLLLPVTHFLVTFTLPEELRSLARANQKIVYHILFRASSEALQQLALDPRFIGGRIGMVGVLHTWTRDLMYHPHVHYIVTGGGLTEDGKWHS